MIPDKAKFLFQSPSEFIFCPSGWPSRYGWVRFPISGSGHLQGGPWVGRGEQTAALVLTLSLFLLTLNPESITVIALGSSLPDTIHCYTGLHCSYLKCPFVPLYLYKVYSTFIVTQDESWKVKAFYGRKRTKPSSSKAQRGCPRSVNWKIVLPGLELRF